MVVRRTRSKPVTAVVIPGKLGAMLGRRVGQEPEARGPVPASKPDKRGSVVPLPLQSELVLTSILGKARSEIRAPRKGKYIHVSDLLSKCLRKKSILELHEVKVPTVRLSLMDALTFRQGDAIHDVVKERAASGSPSQVWGRWKCRCGGLRVDEPCLSSEVDRDIQCDYCETSADFYEEAEFIDSELHIVGHPDLILFLEDLDAFYVTELKSISHEQFKELVRPKPDHVLQSLFYWFLMKRAGYRMVDTVSLLYITKGYVFKGSPFKEFTFHAPTELKRLNTYIEDAKAVLDARKTGKLPPRTFCASREAPTARACEVCSICFEDSNAKKPVTVTFSQTMRSAKKV